MKSKYCSNCGIPFPIDSIKKEDVIDYKQESSSSKATGFLIGFGLIFGIGFLIFILANIGNGSGNSGDYPTCMKWGLGFQVSDGWGWGRPDGKVGYCVLPNSNEVIYSQIGSLD